MAIYLSQVPSTPPPTPAAPAFNPATFDWSADTGLYVPTRTWALAPDIPYRPIQPGAEPAVESVYGSAFNIDSKNNFRLNGQDCAFLFKALSTTTVTGIVWQIRRGVGYSAGSLGTVRVSIQADDGTANHRPDGVDLAFVDVAGGADHGGADGGYVIWSAFSSPPSITADALYHVVFHNTNGSPTVNYVSTNHVWTSGSTLNPRQPAFLDEEFKVSQKVSGSWSTIAKDTADVDVWCADGTHPGSAYLQAKIDFWGVISGSTSMVRERFTVSGGDKTVAGIHARVSKQSGSGNMNLRLEDGSGTLIETLTVSAAGVASWTLGGDPAAGTWLGGDFVSGPYTLTDGNEYRVVLSSDVGTSLAMVPMLYRDASDDGTHYMHSRRFTDGTAEKTTNSGGSWASIYGGFANNGQVYLDTVG